VTREAELRSIQTRSSRFLTKLLLAWIPQRDRRLRSDHPFQAGIITRRPSAGAVFSTISPFSGCSRDKSAKDEVINYREGIEALRCLDPLKSKSLFALLGFGRSLQHQVGKPERAPECGTM